MATNRKKGQMKSHKKLSGGGRKRMSLELDSVLFNNWIFEMRHKGLRVSRRSIREKEKLVFPTLSNTHSVTFNASIGWLNKFLARNRLSLRRRRTKLAQKDPAQLQSKIVSLIMHVSRMVNEKKLKPDSIIAMDETSIWFDMNNNTTVKLNFYTAMLVLIRISNSKFLPTIFTSSLCSFQYIYVIYFIQRRVQYIIKCTLEDRRMNMRRSLITAGSLLSAGSRDSDFHYPLGRLLETLR